MFSYWEQRSFMEYDHVVVGAGIVGLSVALELKGRYAGARVLVLERGLLPTGASTRNAGFACMGSATELLDDLRHTPEDEVVSLFAARKKGLELLRARLGDERIGYRADGGYELISEREMYAFDRLDELNRLLLPVAGKEAFRPANDKIGEFGFAGAYAKGLIANMCEGGLNTGMMMRALTDLVMGKGIEIKAGADVAGYEEQEGYVSVEVRDPYRDGVWALKGRTMTICTNAFTKALLPDVDVIPGRGQVLVTQPIPGLKIKGVFHFDQGYYYFREIDGRVLIGGGRNLDFEGEETTDMALNKLIQIDLEEKLAAMILPGVHFQVAQRWAGIMAFGKTKYPIVKRFSPRVFGAFRMGGMGVALGSETAQRLAELHEEAV